MMQKLQSEFEVVNIEYQKAANTEQNHLKQIKENKAVLKALKNKIIEIEGVVRDFKLFEKQFAIEIHKNLKTIEMKDREIKQLQEKCTQLEDHSGF